MEEFLLKQDDPRFSTRAWICETWYAPTAAAKLPSSATAGSVWSVSEAYNAMVKCTAINVLLAG